MGGGGGREMRRKEGREGKGDEKEGGEEGG